MPRLPATVGSVLAGSSLGWCSRESPSAPASGETSPGGGTPSAPASDGPDSSGIIRFSGSEVHRHGEFGAAGRRFVGDRGIPGRDPGGLPAPIAVRVRVRGSVSNFDPWILDAHPERDEGNPEENACNSRLG